MNKYTVAHMVYYQAEAESEEGAIRKVKAHINNVSAMLFNWKDDGSKDCNTKRKSEYRIIECETSKNIKYGDWAIIWNPKPIPTFIHDYEGVHDDYDGPEDPRAFTGPSIKDIKQQIDDYEAEN